MPETGHLGTGWRGKSAYPSEVIRPAGVLSAAANEWSGNSTTVAETSGGSAAKPPGRRPAPLYLPLPPERYRPAGGATARLTSAAFVGLTDTEID